MVQPFLGSLMSIAVGYTPKGFATCNGQLLPINQNQALFSLMGTTFGGNGSTNFGLPNLQSRTPVGPGTGFVLGQLGGEESHTLVTLEMPAHRHSLFASGFAPSFPKVNGNSPGITPSTAPLYGPLTQSVPMTAAFIPNAGQSQAHENRQPFLVINWVIALVGIFPSRN